MNKNMGKKITSLLFVFTAMNVVAENETLYFDESGSGEYTLATSGLDASAQLKCHYTGRYPLRFLGYRFRDLAYDFRAKTITAKVESRDSISIKFYRSTGRVQCFGPERTEIISGGDSANNPINNEGGESNETPVSTENPSPSTPTPVVPEPSVPAPSNPVAEEPVSVEDPGANVDPVPVQPLPIEPEPVPEPVEDSNPSLDPVPTDPAPADPVPEEEGDTSHNHEGGSHSNDDVNDGSTGSYPAGDPGSSTFDVRYTGQLPRESDGTGNFRTRCEYSHALKDDPIVYPGQPGRSHLHVFYGNTEANAHSTVSSIKNSGNSTCRGGIANRSSYWMPAVLKLDGNMVVPEYMDVYYKSGYSLAPNTIQPFPRGLRMIAGDMNATSQQFNAYWGCGNYIGEKFGIPFGQCGSDDYYKATVVFPQCWDGVNLDSADHKSHMAYPSGNSCPSSHPVPIPKITFHLHYSVRGFDGVKISSDHNSAVPPGGSLHADWFEGWDADIADTFVRQCVTPAVDCHSHLVGDGRAID
ncbi:DUF1996 domain-containing protein [Aurantivibrio infirmus]